MNLFEGRLARPKGSISKELCDHIIEHARARNIEFDSAVWNGQAMVFSKDGAVVLTHHVISEGNYK